MLNPANQDLRGEFVERYGSTALTELKTTLAFERKNRQLSPDLWAAAQATIQSPVPFSTSCARDKLIKWVQARAAQAFSPASPSPTLNPSYLPPSFLTVYPWGALGVAWVITVQVCRPGTQAGGKVTARKTRDTHILPSWQKTWRGFGVRRCALCWQGSRHLTAAEKTDASGQHWRDAHTEGVSAGNTAATLWDQPVRQPHC